MAAATFPPLQARDLEGREVELPADLPGDLTVVLVAFHRTHQRLVDSWLPWLQERAAEDDRLAVVELPTIGLQWAPARAAIDGGMASAIPDPDVRRRTLTVYTDVRRVTTSLGLEDRDTIALVLADRQGRVLWEGTGGYDDATAAGLAEALERRRPPRASDAAQVERFEMAFDPRFRLPLAAAGVTPTTAHVTLGPDRLVACFGPWVCETTPDNVREVKVSGPYKWFRAIGPRLSLSDRGLTFGTTTEHGVCLSLREPVRGLDPLGVLRHPNLTLTVADPHGFAAAVRRRIS